MKFRNLVGGSLIVMALLGATTSCKSGEQKLAENLAGVWAGTPENFTDNQAVTASVTDTYYFQADTTASQRHPSGPVTIQGMITVSTQIVAEGEEIEPLSITAAAVASIEGYWTVVDDDEVALSLDTSTLKVNVDPEQLIANGSLIVSGESPRIESVRPAVAANIERSLRVALSERYAGVNIMDDIKIKGSLLKYEFGHKDYVLTRQTEKLSK